MSHEMMTRRYHRKTASPRQPSLQTGKHLSIVVLGAHSHDMTGLLALVANTILLRGAVTAQVTDLTTVVALLALGAVTRHVSVTTTGVAGLSATALSSVRRSATVAALAAIGSTATTTTTVGAVAGNVSDLTAFVALSSGRGAAEGATLLGIGIVTLAGQVTNFTALIARLLLRSLLAFAAQMAILTAVVANGVAALGALASLMTALATIVASTTANGTAAIVIVRTVGIHKAEVVQVSKLKNGS